MVVPGTVLLAECFADKTVHFFGLMGLCADAGGRVLIIVAGRWFVFCLYCLCRTVFS